MNCRYCGASLPTGALFCGECGRSVSGERTLKATPVRRPVSSAPLIPSVSAPRAPLDETGSSPCPQCGQPIGADDVFCRECGFVVRTVALGRDTVVVGDAAPTPPGPRETETAADAAVSDAPELAVAAAPAPPDAFPWGLDLAPRRAQPAAQAGERFVLQFSTGESVSVTGTGLIGRNPVAQPGEFVDQFVVVGDAGKSVSKTHLEFGQDAGTFWVSDRYSTNGSTLRPPDGEPRRCEPGRRYRLERGTRVDIGDQFFVVS